MTTPQEPHVRPFAEFLRDAFGQVLDVIREADFDPWLVP